MVACCLLTAMLAAPSVPPAPPPARVWGVTDAVGEFQGIKKNGERYEVMIGTTALPLDEIARVSRAEHDPTRGVPRVVAILSDRSELWGDLLPGDGEAVSIRMPILGTRAVALEKLAAIVFPPSFPTVAAFEAFRLAQGAPPASDTIHTVEGTTATGIIERIDPEKIVLAGEAAATTTYPIGRVRGCSLAQVDPPAARTGLVVGVALSDGSFVQGTIAAADGMTCTLGSALGELAIDLAKVVEISTSGGAWVPLGELEPSARAEKSFVGDVVWPARRNANVLGGPLSVHGTRYRRGLGVHSYSRYTYALGSRFVRFQALAALDDVAVDENLDTRFGNAVFAVYVDGQKRFDSGDTSWNDPPRPISIDVTGAQTIELEVNPGIGFHVRDRADWIEPRLLRARGATP